MNNKVFISYAKEDYEFAKRLYDFLKLNEFSPWLDKECLLPGQNWDLEINKALKGADFIILLISNYSIRKRGYVQREYKLALKFYEEKLEDDIYLLPIKIDSCDVPFGFEKFQWYELNEKFDFYKILDSLIFQKKKIELQSIKIFNKETQFEYKEKKIIKETGINPKRKIEIYYPQFTTTTNDDIQVLNNHIENEIFSIYSAFLNPIRNSIIPITYHNNDSIESDWELNIKYDFKIISKNLICLNLFTLTYTGGAHENYWTVGYNYRLNPYLKISINDIFNRNTHVLDLLISLLKEKIEKYAFEKFNISDVNNFYLNELQIQWDEIDNISICKEGIVFIFHTYQLTAYALGEHEILVTYDELLNSFPNSEPLMYLKEQMTSIHNTND